MRKAPIGSATVHRPCLRPRGTPTHAIRVHAPGGPEALTYEEVPDPKPSAGEIVIQIEAIGVNFIDVYQRSGVYKLPTPFGLGVEAAGVVVAVGDGVSEFQTGDRVAHAMQRGAYAQCQAVPAAQVVRVPGGIDSATAAAALLQGMTAHYLVHSTIALRTGHSVLVHAGAGGVGRLLIQMARRAGAYVLTTVSTDAKAAEAQAVGANEVIVYTQADFAEAVRVATDGLGLDVVYDSVGQATFVKGLDCLRPRGLMVLFGASSGAVAPLDPQVLNQKGSLFLTRPNLSAYTRTRDELEWRAEDVFALIRDGSLKLKVDRTLPLREAAEAHRALEGRQTSGKVLLIP